VWYKYIIMLNNILFYEINHFYLKNNLFFVNIICYKIPNNILLNINLTSINFLEKFSIEYFLKNIFNSLFFKNKILIIIWIQLLPIYILI